VFNVDNLTQTDKSVLYTQTFQRMFVYRVHASIKHWAFLLIGFPALFAAYSSLFLDKPMTDWKDSIDSWKDSNKPPRQLIAAPFSWKILRTQSTGSTYMFTNYKLRRPACLIHLAGTTPQRHVKLAATALWWWSKCLLQIYFFNFFCLSKALQFKNKTQITPDSSLYSMTERHSRVWKEPEQFQLLCCTFCLSNVRCTMVVSRIWQEPHHRVVYRLHRPLMVFPNFTLHETIILFAPKAFFKEIRILCFANYLPNAKSVFHFVFASMLKLNM